MKRLLCNVALCLALVAAIFVTSCSNYGNKNGPGASSGANSVTITSPGTPQTIQQGQTVPITASVANDNTYNRGVAWSLTGQGTLSGQTPTTVTYNAPASVTSNITATVTATSVSDMTKSASITITVTPISSAIVVTIASPGTPQTIQQGQTVPITASVANDNTYNRGVAWSLTGQGTLSGQTPTTVTYNAPASVTSNITATVTATSVSDMTKSASITITVTPPPPISVSIINKISSIGAGADAVTFKATVQNDSSNRGVSWALNANGAGGSSCDPTCGTLTNATTTSVTYTPPATVPAPPNYAPTLVATSVADTTKSDSDSFTIPSSNNNAELKGQYAFLVSGFDDTTGEQFAYIGSLTADGNGGITSGIEDVNFPSGVKTSVAIEGYYTVGADNRGTATITSASGSNTFAFSVGAIDLGIATKAHIIEFDDSTGTSGRRGSGVAYLQDSTAFNLASVSGSYAAQFVGQESTGGRLVNSGVFTANGTGGITGTLDSNWTGDFNTDGTFSGGITFTATLASGAATATNGRAAVTTPGGTGTSVVYIISAGHLLLMSTDLESANGLTSGEILKQTSTSFTNADLSGTDIFYSTGVLEAGSITFDSTAGSAIVSADYNDGRTASTLTGYFIYTVQSNGHVFFFNVHGGSAPDMFLISPNKAFVMETGANVSGGLLEGQSSGPFANSSINGNYFFGLAESLAITRVATRSGVATSTGNGILNATVDLSQFGGQLLSGQTQTFVLTIDPATGRVTEPGGSIFYIISPTRLVGINGTGQNPSVIIAEQ